MASFNKFRAASAFFCILLMSSVLSADAQDSSGSSPTYDYSKVLGLSFLFYEAQRTGKLPPTNRIAWRGDAFLNDCNGTMAQGYSDAGDTLKLFFPLSTSLTFLGLSIAQFKDVINGAGQMSYALNTLKWGADSLIAAHIAPNKFIGQIGDPGIDHSYWGRPEQFPSSLSRPCYVWDVTSQPASDLLSAAVSALAATSIVFKDYNSTYADTALTHAKQLYTAATSNEGKYSSSYSSATYVYQSSSFRDDLALAAAMLWKATGDPQYLTDTKAQRSKPDFSVESYVSWDAVGPVSAILLKCGGQETSESAAHISRFLSDWTNCNNNGFQKTPNGLCIAPLGGWGNLRYAANAAFASLLYADCETSNPAQKSSAIAFAQSQINYALGSGGRSFVVGYGTNPPTHCHHKAASCPNMPAVCDWNNFNTPNPNPQVIYGALVGGPAGPGDSYSDVRSNYQTNEVAVDYNAGFTGALAGLLKLTSSSPSTPQPPLSSGPPVTSAEGPAPNPAHSQHPHHHHHHHHDNNTHHHPHTARPEPSRKMMI